MIKNPIIPGFFPDPSIIRVEDDFYIINSSFEYFPAIPIWHSKDLMHWKQIGNAVTDEKQKLGLKNVNCSGGVQAATIRHHNGRFYITSTRVETEWPRNDYNFILYADDIHGPWSEVIYLDDAPGIDSSLFFDEDKAYFLANRQKEDTTDGGDTEIWIQEIDLNTFKLIGEKHALWDGTGGIFPEGPHMYKRNGYYYLLIAEGGTLHNHTVSFARSDSPFGPFKSVPRNPVLTHKHLSREYPIQNVGHADMVELKDGSWYGVCLGSRPRGGFYDGGNIKYSFGGYYRNLGRETFLFPVTWPLDDASPLFTPDTGRVEFSYPTPNLEEFVLEDTPIDFSKESLDIKWCVIKQEKKEHIRLEEDNLYQTLKPSVEESFIGFRQTSWNFDFKVQLDISNLDESDYSAVGMYMTKDANLSVECRNGSLTFLSKHKDDVLNNEIKLSETKVVISIKATDQDYTFVVTNEEGNIVAEHTFDGRILSADLNDTHTGTFIGFYGASKTDSVVRYSNVNYTAK